MTVLAWYLRDRRRSTLWWTAGTAAVVLLIVGLYPSVKGDKSVDDLVDNMPVALRSAFAIGQGAAFSSAPGYLHARLFSVILPAVLLIFAIGVGVRAIGGSEDEGTLELLLANPVTRRRVALERYGAAAVLVGGLGVLAGVFTVAMAAMAGALDGVDLAGLVAECVGAAAMSLLFASLAFAAGAWTGRRATATAVAGSAAVGTFLLQTLVAVVDAVHPLRVLSPWHWYQGRNMLVDGVAPDALLVPVAVSAVLVAAGLWRFDRRDLR